jgi:hypothetical protein
MRWPWFLWPSCRPPGELPTLHEGDEPLGEWGEGELDLPELAGPPAAGLGTFELLETEQRPSQTQRETQAISEETVAVMNALRQMDGERHGSRKTLQLDECVAGLQRGEAARVFYQALGALAFVRHGCSTLVLRRYSTTADGCLNAEEKL